MALLDNTVLALIIQMVKNNWASVSKPHTALATLRNIFLSYLYATVTVLLNNISFRFLHLVRVRCPDTELSAPPIVKATAHQGRAVNLRVACALAV